jgi:hypothetical protein
MGVLRIMEKLECYMYIAKSEEAASQNWTGPDQTQVDLALADPLLKDILIRRGGFFVLDRYYLGPFRESTGHDSHIFVSLAAS